MQPGLSEAAPSPPADPFPMREFEFVGLMAMLMALQALAIDVMLPALGAISYDLGVDDPNDRQYVVGIFLLFSGLASIFPGAVADRFGRRPVILACLGFYFVLCLSCALVTDFTVLLILRAVMGAITSGLMVLPMTVIRDRFSGDRMARMQSLVAVMFMAIPMLAPIIGQGILIVAGWRWIFALQGILAVVVAIWAWLRLPETLDAANRQTIRPRTVLTNMKLALTLRSTLGYIVGVALIQMAIFGFINSAQQLVAEALGAGEYFPLVFAGMAFCMAAANFGNSRIVERFGARPVSHAALVAFIAVSGVHLLIAATGNETLWIFAPLFAVNMACIAFISANFQSITLEPFGRIAGAAASAMTFVRMVVGSFLGILVGQAFDGTAVPLTASFFVGGLIALGLVAYSEKGELFTRRNAPGSR